MISTIRFLRPNRYRKAVGELDSQMGYGVHETLVSRGIAEFVTEKIEPSITEPEAIRDRKPRRYSQKES